MEWVGRGRRVRRGRSRKNMEKLQPCAAWRALRRHLQVYGLDSERLYASYFGGDEELLGYRSIGKPQVDFKIRDES